MWWVWRWLLFAVALGTTMALPVPDEIIDTSTKLLGSSVVTSVSVIMDHEDGSSEKLDTRKVVTEDLPPSTVDMLKPDGFQFYTVDEKGQLITRQMTDAEIQSIIAAGGGPFPMETQDPQKTGENISGETKVADVVENVQKVLKGELSKPATAMGTVPTIPGHASDEWSSILPSILGGDAESAPVSLPEDDEDDKLTEEMINRKNITEATSLISVEKVPVTESPEIEIESPKPIKEETKIDEMLKIDENQKIEGTEQPGSNEETVPKEPQERPMIQVPVITADSVLSTTKNPTVLEEKPVYQILNTISAEEVKDKDTQVPQETKLADVEQERNATVTIPEKESTSATTSASEKTENEVKEPEIVEELPTTTAKTFETVIEMEVSSSFVPSVQESSVTTSSGLKEKVEIKPTVDMQKIETPSIILEAPVAEEKPVIKEKEPENIPEVKPAIKEKEPEVIPEAKPAELPISVSQESETTTLSATVEEEVSEIVNLIPEESISSIVEELISDEVKSEDPEVSILGNNQEIDVTKVQDSGDKTDDGNSSASKAPENSDVKITPEVIPAPEIPEIETETVFQMLPEITPDSSVTKSETEASASLENVANKPETTETVSEATKIEEYTATNTQNEIKQGLIPLVEVSAPVTAGPNSPVTSKKDDSDIETTQATVEKKPGTLLTELADSVSSMISQVSETMPSMVPIPQKSETTEQSVKRVEDGVKEGEDSTVSIEVPSSTVKTETQEAEKPSIENVESETIEPEITKPEIEMVEVKAPEPTTINSILDTPESTKIPEQVSTEISDVKKTETVVPEDQKTEQVTPADSESMKISETSSEKAPVKSKEEDSTLKPEDSKPEKIELVVQEEHKTETVDSASEAPIVTESKPTESDTKNVESTESSMVKVQLTNTVETINEMIDSAPEITSPVEVQEILLPEKNILEGSSPQNMASSLIAGNQPSNVMETETPDVSNSPDNQVLENPQLTETASIDSDLKTTSKPDAEKSSDDKPKPDIKNETEIEVTQGTIEAKPEVNEKSPTPETEVKKTTKKPVEIDFEIQNSNYTVASVEPEVKIDPPVLADDKIESPTKSGAQESPTEIPEKIFETATVISEDKIEETDLPKPIEKVVEIPGEVVVSKIVDVEPTKESLDKIEDLKSGEKIEETNTNIEKPVETIGNVISESKVEADKTETKINETLTESETPAPTQPAVQASDHEPNVSTPAATSEHKENEKTESQGKVEAPTTAQTVSEIKKTETTDIKNELPDEIESGDVAQAVKESLAKPEVIKTENQKSPSIVNEPEKKVSGDVKESSIPDSVQKDQPAAPLVRIDVSPEKNQPENTTTKILENADDKETAKPDEPLATEMKLPEAEEPLDKIGEEPAVETSSTKPVETAETGISTLETSSNSSEVPAPAKIDSEENKVQTPDVKEPEIFVVENVKETDSQLPEVIETTSTASPSIAKIESNVPPKTQEVRIRVNDTAVLVTQQQIPEKGGSDDKKVEKPEVLDTPMNRIEVSTQKPDNIEILKEPTKLPTIEKPTPVVTSSQQTDKTTPKQDGDEVKAESSSEQKKPAIDPYVKLGEKKPVDGNVVKAQNSGNKKPAGNENNKNSEEKWTLIPQSETKPVIKQQTKLSAEEPSSINKNENVSVPLEAHHSAVSLIESTRDQDEDISQFSKLCNELAFSFWIAANKGLSTARSLALSPFGMTSMLAMVFLGARGPTSGQMNDILKLDDVVTFNPHLVFQNVSDSVNLARGQGIANAAFVRELFADRLKAGRLLPFYKERAQQFYDGHVEEVNFATISDLVRRRTNLLIRRQTGGRIRDFVKGNVMPLRSPLAALSANVFQTDCTGASSEGRDGEMYFAVLPAVRQRKLVPVPATVWRSGVLAGYEPGLDATVISLGGVGNLVSTIFVVPGQQGLAAPGDSLDLLEKRLLEGAFADGIWDRLLRVLIPRVGLEVQVPKFSHRSVVNATAALKRMGLDDLFSKHADLKGINGVGNDLHLADMLQINLFSTCGDEVITGGRHHVEIYPATPLRGARGDKKSIENEEQVEDPEALDEDIEGEIKIGRSLNVGEYVQLSHDLEKRSAPLLADKKLISEDIEDEERSERSSNNSKELLQFSKGKQNERPLLKLDRPFLYFVRHNPTGMILHMGRFNPRLMP